MGNCVERGAIYVATSGVRTYAEQNALYAKGRTTAPIGKGHIVTMARGGFSPHNFACAVDLTRHKGDTYDGKLIPDYGDASYGILAEEAAKLGLDPGLYWKSLKDAPHIQLNLRSKKITWAMMRDWYAIGGQAHVFKQLDAHGPWGTVAVP